MQAHGTGMIKLLSKDVLKLRRSCLVRSQLSLLPKAKAHSRLVVHSGLLSVCWPHDAAARPASPRAAALQHASWPRTVVQHGLLCWHIPAGSWLQLCRRTTCLKAETMDSQVRPGLPWFVPLNIEQYSVNAAQSSSRDRRIGGGKKEHQFFAERLRFSTSCTCIACLVPRGSVAVCLSLNTSFSSSSSSFFFETNYSLLVSNEHSI